LLQFSVCRLFEFFALTWVAAAGISPEVAKMVLGVRPELEQDFPLRIEDEY